MQLNTPLYSLGPAGAPLWQGNATDPRDCAWVVTGEAGWSSSPPARPSDTDKTLGDGTLEGEGWYTGRLVTLEGTCVAPDQVSMLWAKEYVKSAVGPWDLVTLTVDELHLSRKSDVRLHDQVDIADKGPLAFTWQMGLFAGDPRRYAVTSETLTCGLPSEAGLLGRTYPRGYPLSYGGGGEGADGAVVFTNAGNFKTTPAVITITGPVINPVIEHAESGASLTFGLTVAYGQALVVDLGAESALLQGAQAANLLTPASAWFMLAPGDNLVAFRGEAGTAPGGVPGAPQMTLVAASAWS